MPRWRLWIVFLALGASACSAAEPKADGATLTPEGWGPIRIGMTRAEVVAAAGEDAHPEAVGGPEPEICDEFRPEDAPEGMRVMIERDRLTRISLSRDVAVATERGFRVGDPASAVAAAYGASALVAPHQYISAPARYITVWKIPPPVPDPVPSDPWVDPVHSPEAAGARGLVYEIGGDDRILHIHAGGPSIQYVEGCL